eukprot:5788946-Ditylum_brightwellii.AAC.1
MHSNPYNQSEEGSIEKHDENAATRKENSDTAASLAKMRDTQFCHLQKVRGAMPKVMRTAGDQVYMPANVVMQGRTEKVA